MACHSLTPIGAFAVGVAAVSLTSLPLSAYIPITMSITMMIRAWDGRLSSGKVRMT